MTSDDCCTVEFIEFKGVEAGHKGVLVIIIVVIVVRIWDPQTLTELRTRAESA